MAGSTIGRHFTITTWGESHGKGIGVVVDGVPAGINISEEYIQEFLNRRRPGQSRFTTPRNEKDKAVIMSGVFEGKTTGTPISIIVFNEDQHSKDYSEIAEVFRPGHADYTFYEKFGIRDYRGGGRSSGRETIGRVAAGAVAMAMLKELGVSILTYTRSIGDIEIDKECFDKEYIKESPLYMPDREACKKAQEYIGSVMSDRDSCGGVIECIIENLPAGTGEPVFDKLDACLAKAVMSIGAVKGFEIGDGMKAAVSRGSVNNDAFGISGEGKVVKLTNHSGGVLGGMSDSSQVIFRAAVKPTPSISREQKTVDIYGNERKINIKGRHDPIIVPRAVVVVEAMAACVTADLILEGAVSRMENVKKIYER